MKTYDYWGFVDLFCIKDLQKAKNDWFGFRVSKAGVALIDQRELCNPIGNNQLYSEEERRGRKESLICPPALLEFAIQRPTRAPNIPTGVEIVNRARKMIVPPSPPMQPTWQEGYVKEGNLLLEFPCNKEDLRSFIKLTRLDFMLPPGHELLNDAHNATAGQPTTGNPEPAQRQKSKKSRSSIREAVNYAYDRLVQSGNTETVKQGNVRAFLKHLKECITKGEKNYSEYISKRIKEVKNVTGECIVIGHATTDAEKLRVAKTGKNITSNKARISTMLCELRKED